jgi:hypothetical protein
MRDLVGSKKGMHFEATSCVRIPPKHKGQRAHRYSLGRFTSFLRSLEGAPTVLRAFVQASSSRCCIAALEAFDSTVYHCRALPNRRRKLP